MTCEVREDKWWSLYDGRLDAEERRAVEEHLAVCPECRARWAQVEALALAIASLAPGDAGASATRAAQAYERRRRAVMKTRLSAAAACLVLAVGAALFLLRGEGASPAPGADPAPAVAGVTPSAPDAAPDATDSRDRLVFAWGRVSAISAPDAFHADSPGPGSAVMRMEAGFARFHVDPGAGADVQVVTPDVTVIVSGTVFSVWVRAARDATRTEVAVEEGRVKVVPHAGGAPRFVDAGQTYASEALDPDAAHEPAPAAPEGVPALPAIDVPGSSAEREAAAPHAPVDMPRNPRPASR